jgi:curved DNA-binding protein
MAVEFKDYYRVLGVTPQATSDEIKKAFRALARKYHPDVAKDKKAAEEKFKEINEANEVLSNPESRKKFDELGADWKAGAAPRESHGRSASRSAEDGAQGGDDDFQFGGTGFSDFFEQYFGGHTERPGGGSPFGSGEFGGRHGQSKAARQGHDIQGDILITLDEVIKGAVRAISVRRTNGRTGHEEMETYQVRIPKGVQADQTIRLSGKGGAGTNGGQPGDIYLRVRYAQHPDWQVQGADLIGVLELAPWEAILGATVPVATLDGNLSVKVPAGFQQGQRLRMRGKGLPVGAAKFGDLFVEVSIQVPLHSGKEEERLWKELASVSHFNPRNSPVSSP